MNDFLKMCVCVLYKFMNNLLLYSQNDKPSQNIIDMYKINYNIQFLVQCYNKNNQLNGNFFSIREDQN